jgi:antitoxin (DNA-binding transcriptional repressor) of toxin-antitoxin stability system
MTTRTVTATEARVRLGEILREVDERGTTVILERGGRAVAAVVPLGRLDDGERDRRRRDAEVRLAALRELRARVAARMGDRPVPDPVEILRQERERRDAHLLDLLGLELPRPPDAPARALGAGGEAVDELDR